MPVSPRKKSKSRRDMRRSTHKLKPVQSNECPRCGTAKLPHRVCVHCGYYKKEDILRLEAGV